MKWGWDKFGYNIVGPSTDMATASQIIRQKLQLHENEIAEIKFYSKFGRAIILIRDYIKLPSKSLIRIASRDSDWDVAVYFGSSFEAIKRRAIRDFKSLMNVNEANAEILVQNGFFTLNDLTLIEPSTFSHICGIGMELIDAIIEECERRFDDQRSD